MLFSLLLTLASGIPPPGCGDGTLDCAIEECDDGNNISLDGCSAFCVDEIPFEDNELLGVSNDWFDCNNWSLGKRPAQDDRVTFRGGAGLVIDVPTVSLSSIQLDLPIELGISGAVVLVDLGQTDGVVAIRNGGSLDVNFVNRTGGVLSSEAGGALIARVFDFGPDVGPLDGSTELLVEDSGVAFLPPAIGPLSVSFRPVESTIDWALSGVSVVNGDLTLQLQGGVGDARLDLPGGVRVAGRLNVFGDGSDCIDIVADGSVLVQGGFTMDQCATFGAALELLGGTLSVGQSAQLDAPLVIGPGAVTLAGDLIARELHVVAGGFFNASGADLVSLGDGLIVDSGGVFEAAGAFDVEIFDLFLLGPQATFSASVFTLLTGGAFTMSAPSGVSFRDLQLGGGGFEQIFFSSGSVTTVNGVLTANNIIWSSDGLGQFVVNPRVGVAMDDVTLSNSINMAPFTGPPSGLVVDGGGNINWFFECGNGTLEPAEECDDGGRVNGDGCTDLCLNQVAGCGDGTYDCNDGEQCDDGNNFGGDGCDAGCVREGPVTVTWIGDASSEFTDCAAYAEGMAPGPLDRVVLSATSGDMIVTSGFGANGGEGEGEGEPDFSIDQLFLFGGYQGTVTLAEPMTIRLVVADDGTLEILTRLLVREDFTMTGTSTLRAPPAPLVFDAFSGHLDTNPLSIRGVIMEGDGVIDGNITLDFGAQLWLSPTRDALYRFVPPNLPDQVVWRPQSGQFGAPVTTSISNGLKNMVVSIEGIDANLLMSAEIEGEIFVDERAPATVSLGALPFRDGGGFRSNAGASVDVLQLTMLGGAHSIEAGDTHVGTCVALAGSISTVSGRNLDQLIVLAGSTVVTKDEVTTPMLQVSGLVVGNGSMSVDETLMFTDGTFVAPDDLFVTRRLRLFDPSASFVHGNGRVHLVADDIELDIVAGGEIAFYDLLAEVPGSLIGFHVDSTVRVDGTWTVRGDAANPIRMRSAFGPASQRWRVLPTGGVDVDFVDVQSSHNIGANLINPPNFIDSGNNIGWGVAPDACAGYIGRTGPVTLDDNAAVLALNAAGVECIAGDLIIGPGVTDATLTTLIVVTGSIIVRAGAVVTVSLPALEEAGAVIIEDNASLTAVDYGELESVTGDVTIVNNDALTSLDIGDLEQVGGDVLIDDNDALETVEASSLVEVGGDVTLSQNDLLRELVLALLETIGGSLTVDQNAALLALVLPLLDSVLENVVITDNDGLVAVVLPSLIDVGGDISINGNDVLADVDISEIVDVGGDISVDADDVDLGPGFTCTAGVCATDCGDGVRAGDEACDDNNRVSGDGCDSSCIIEAGFICRPSLTGDACARDDDEDGVPDDVDNCVGAGNPGQENADGDAFGDACDRDDDDDGVVDLADDCPLAADAEQTDADADSIGDACDDEPLGSCGGVDEGDADGDGLGDSCDDDRDGDGVVNDSDVCADVPDVAQGDVDGDGAGDACDADADGDALVIDPCPLATLAACAGDADGDGTLDAADACATLADAGDDDADNDGLGDGCDSDKDGDGAINKDDVCPDVADASQADADADGVGDACDVCPDVAGATSAGCGVPDVVVVVRPPAELPPAPPTGCGCGQASAASALWLGLALVGIGARARRSSATDVAARAGTP